MESAEATLNKIKEASKRRILFLPHAIRQMSRPDRMIGAGDVKRIIAEGEVVEDYPEDIRGHSRLMMGFDKEGRPIHILCTPSLDSHAQILT
jgi:hypothetical protein